MHDVVNIKELQRRRKIEDDYQASIKAWDSQLDFAIRMLKTEYDIKVSLAKKLREQQLMLDYDEQWPQWPGNA